MIREKKLGALKEFNSVNSQNMGDPQHWRLKKALAGGGALPDIGIYCINAARFLSGEEPTEVFGSTWSTPGDARFREVGESCQFVLRFPSGFAATCSTSYSAHKSQMFRLNGFEAWADIDPAYAYHGNKLRITRVVDGKDQTSDIPAGKSNQFTLMIDHFANCIQQNKDVHTPGEEGLQTSASWMRSTNRRVAAAWSSSSRRRARRVGRRLKAPIDRLFRSTLAVALRLPEAVRRHWHHCRKLHMANWTVGQVPAWTRWQRSWRC